MTSGITLTPLISQVISLYLYGTTAPPTDKAAEDLIRPAGATTSISMSASSFMTTGAGRYAKPSQFEVVSEFFNSGNTVAAGTYTFSQILGVLGLTVPGVDYSTVAIDQKDYSSGNDYLERVLLINNTEFRLANTSNMLFHVSANGDRSIDNVQVVPENENFDLVGGGFFTQYLNEAIAPFIDPSDVLINPSQFDEGLGRRVDINFTGTVPTTTTYTQFSYNDDSNYISGEYTEPFSVALLAPFMQDLLNELWVNGYTDFLDEEDRPILYGTDSSDTIDAVQIDDIFNSNFVADWFGQSFDDIHNISQYSQNGVLILSGQGDDDLTGSNWDDRLHGGEGNDLMDGNLGFDISEYEELDAVATSLTVSSFAISKSGGGSFTVQINYNNGSSELDSYSNVERIAHAEQQANAYVSGMQNNPSVSSKSGGYVSFWQSAGQGGKTQAVIRQEFDLSGNKVGSESLVTVGAGVQQLSPESAELNSGGYVVAFQGRNVSSKIKTFAKIFDGSSASADIEVFKDPTTGNTSYDNSLKTQEFAKDVAVLSSGNILTVAQASGNFTLSGQFDIIGKFHDTSGNALGEKFIINDDAQSGWQTEPSVAALTDGNAVVTWTSGDSWGNGVFFRIIDTTGAGVNSTTQVNNSTAYNQNDSDVAALKDGGFVVTWTDQGGADGSGYGIFFKVFDNSGNEVVGETQVNDQHTSTQWQSEVTALDDGGFVITFTDNQSSSDGSGASAWAQQYDKFGSAIQENFLVNITTAGAQQNTVVTGLENGDFAVAWEDQTSEVYERLYSNSAPVSPPPAAAMSSGGSGSGSSAFTSQSSAREFPLYEEPEFLVQSNGVKDAVSVSKRDYRNDLVDIVSGFDVKEGDQLDLSELFAPRHNVDAAIVDFIALSESDGDTHVLVDRDGTGGRHNFKTVAQLTDTIGLKLEDMIDDGSVLV